VRERERERLMEDGEKCMEGERGEDISIYIYIYI
jgi:hypothetical protein